MAYQPTAKEVAALRNRTGAGMMDCKNALVETNGDIEKALTSAAEGDHQGREARGAGSSEGCSTVTCTSTGRSRCSSK